MPARSVEQRFWANVSGDDPLGCWTWTGRLNLVGYGQFHVDGKNRSAHRWSYEHLRAQIDPSWLQIDHLCRVRACVNPWHMEPVTAGENTRRAARLGYIGRGANLTPHLAREFVRNPPVYRQLADRWVEMIESSGRPGEQFIYREPVAHHVAANGIKLLEAWGYVELRQGRWGLEAYVLRREEREFG